MAWVKLDVGFPEHPKILGLSDAAFRLHVSALCYASRHLTDGLLPRGWLPSSRQGLQIIQQLVDARLWDAEDDTYRIHDYLGHQRSRASVDTLRAQTSSRVKRLRNGVTPAPRNALCNGVTPPPSNAHSNAVSNADVTLPDTDTDTDTERTKTKNRAQAREAAAAAGPRPYDRSHATHLFGFCEFVCFSEAKATEFAKTLPGGLGEPTNFDTVMAWARSVRDSWAGKAITELKWWEFWEARWRERQTSSTTKTGRTMATLQRLVERHS